MKTDGSVVTARTGGSVFTMHAILLWGRSFVVCVFVCVRDDLTRFGTPRLRFGCACLSRKSCVRACACDLRGFRLETVRIFHFLYLWLMPARMSWRLITIGKLHQNFGVQLHATCGEPSETSSSLLQPWRRDRDPEGGRHATSSAKAQS